MSEDHEFKDRWLVAGGLGLAGFGAGIAALIVHWMRS